MTTQPMANTWTDTTIRNLEEGGCIELGRGQIISQKDIEAIPGDYPVYSSSARGTGEFGRYGKYMFDEELVTWSVDGGGKFFYRPKGRYSITNVSGFLRVKDKNELDTYFVWASLYHSWLSMTFNYTEKLHPSILRERFSISYPTLPKQKAIARVLTTVQDAIAEQEKLIAKLRDLKRSIMHHLFTHGTKGEATKITDIGEVPEGWEIVDFESLCVLQRGKDLTKSNFSSGSTPVAGSNGIIGYHNTANLKAPAVTVGRSGSVGVVKYYDQDVWAHNTALFVKDFKSNDERFTAYYLEYLKLNRFKGGASVPTLDRNQFRTMPLALPKLTEQKLIARSLHSIDEQTRTLEAKLSEYQSLFKTLLHELMSGERRIKP